VVFLQQKCKIFKEKWFIHISLHEEKSKKLKEISIITLTLTPHPHTLTLTPHPHTLTLTPLPHDTHLSNFFLSISP
jgi:hypothetical protein